MLLLIRGGKYLAPREQGMTGKGERYYSLNSRLSFLWAVLDPGSAI